MVCNIETGKKVKFVLMGVVAALFLAVNAAAAPDCPKFLQGRQIGTLQSSLLRETSGIAASRKNPGVLWVHNDSGDSARLFAISTKGAHLGTYNLQGARCRDYEDIAVAPGPDPDKHYLYIADIGDNSSRRSSVVVYRVPEPAVDVNQSPVNKTLTGVEAIALQYPDKPHNAETLMVDPLTRDIYIISKQKKHSRVFRAAYPQSTKEATTMEYKCKLPWGRANGGDISPDGSAVIVRSFSNASIWLRPEGTNLWQAFTGRQCTVPLVIERQGEAVCFDANGSGYFTTSEHLYQPIYYFARDERNSN